MALPKYFYCIPWFLAVCAFVLSFVGTSCNFVQFTSTNEQTGDLTSDTSEPVSIDFGLWYYQSWQVTNSTVLEESCDLYPTSVNVDKNWKAARGFNLIAIILSGSLLFLDMFQGCLSTKKNRSLRAMAVGYAVCFLCAALSLMLLDSNVCKHNTLVAELNQNVPELQFPDTCSLAKGGKATIAATVLFFAAGIGTALLHPVQKRDQGPSEGEGLDEPLFGSDHSGDANLL